MKHGLSIDVSYDPHANEDDEIPEIWFELEMEEIGWGALIFGIDNGSRPCSQRVRIELSNVFDPFPELSKLAEFAFQEKFAMEFLIDSEGPESLVSLRPASQPGLTIFEVRDYGYSVVYFIAILQGKQLGYALGSCLRTALLNPKLDRRWSAWYDPHITNQNHRDSFFKSDWLKNLPDHE